MNDACDNGACDTAGPVRVLSNMDWFEGQTIADRPVEVQRIAETGPGDTLRALRAADPFDAAVINGNPKQLLVFCLWKLLRPGCRWRLVSTDLVVQRPRNWRERIRTGLVRWLLGQVDLFLFFYKDTRAIEDVYGIDHGKVQYVPFKINEYDYVVSHPTSDDGYILSCGQSKRDYGTFCRAMQGLPFEARILAPVGEQTRKHGTAFNFETLPANVRLVVDDGSDASWADWISRSTCIVLPVVADTLTASGISAYLVAMAMGKCVVITDSPATRGLLDDGQAVVVPPADPVALAEALARVCSDEQYRQEVAAAGQEYALSLGGETRLARNVTARLGPLLGIAEPERTSQTDETSEPCCDVVET